VEETIRGTGVEFADKITGRIHGHTQGHAYELQVLCHSLYKNQLKGKVNGQQWEPSLNETLRILGENVFNGWYARASGKEAEVLEVLARFNNPVEFKAVQRNIKLKKAELSSYLERLVEKDVVEKQRMGIFHIPDYLFRSYLLSQNRK
jgi:hypothetical protein